jgi:hypothetical protein
VTVEKGNLPLNLAYTGRAVGSREVECAVIAEGLAGGERVIVEFAQLKVQEGMPVAEAAIEGA